MSKFTKQQKENYHFYLKEFDRLYSDQEYKFKFVVIQKNELKGAFDSFEKAIEFAATNFAVGDFIVQQVIKTSDEIDFTMAAY
jgi:hypothetical protein